MHFFIDPSGLPAQLQSETYGPAADDFRLTAQFTLPEARPAYACQRSQLLVLEATNPDHVTLVLKPLGGLDVGLGAVRYYVYRGVQKDSFLASGALRARTAAGNSAALNLFWKAIDAAKARQPGKPDPVPANLVVPATAATQPLDAYFGGQFDYLSVVVKEGSSLGNFAAATIGFEIITDTYGLTLDLDYGRRASYAMRKTDFDNLSDLAKAAARDTILSFIDPAAFFGLHAEVGLRAGTSGQLLKGAAALAQAVQPFATAHRAYIDIRNEYGRSYNFSGSYHNAAGQDLGLQGAYTTYATAGWPLHYVDLSAAPAGGTNLQLQLRRDANASPQLFCEAGRYGGPAQPLGPCFAPPADLAELSDGWTHPLPFYLPGTAATYLRLHYYRPALLASPPPGVLARGHRLDNLFDLSHLPADAPAGAPVQHAFAPAPVLVTGQRATSLDDYALVATSGTYASNDLAVCYLQEQHAPDYPSRTDLYPPNTTGVAGLFTEVGAGFLRTQVALTSIPVTAAGATPAVQVATIYAYSGTPHYLESLHLLCLTPSELRALADAPGLSPLHPRYLVFRDPAPFTDDAGDVGTRYRVQVQGLNAAGQAALATPTPEVLVYAPLTGFVLASPGTAGKLAATAPVKYQRDAEESIGRMKYNKDPSNGRLEDFYIRQSPQIQAQVKKFADEAPLITDLTARGYAQLTALVDTVGRALFQAGVAYVKAGLGHRGEPFPDDRPLYWGRLKVGVLLKMHPMFATAADLEVHRDDTTSNARIKPASRLARLVRRLEETSRNYTGVDFAAAGPTVKKILLTGYDPFQLNENIYQINPSDTIACALHGESVRNAQGVVIGLLQVMLFPVRYRDFDSSTQPYTGQGEGVAERYIKPFIASTDMIVTISQGGRGQEEIDYYDIEHYATDTRGGFSDNLQDTRPEYSSEQRALPLVPVTAASPDNMEWLETTLPAAMWQEPANLHNEFALERKFDSEKAIITIEGQLLPTAFVLSQPKCQMYSASGGDYLSNEIFYRVARLRQLLRPALPTGHLHTPIIPAYLAPGDPVINKVPQPSDVNFLKLREVIDKCRLIITNGVRAL